jgi:hypothetical protein
MRRRLTSLSREELALLERTETATHIPAWKLLALVLDDASYVFEAHEIRALDDFIERLHIGVRAREVFNKVMSSTGLHISQVKKRSTATPGTNLPRAGEPGVGGSSGPGDDNENKEVNFNGRTNRPE